MPKKAKSIYDLIPGNEEIIRKEISKLPEDEQKIIFLRFGEDLNGNNSLEEFYKNEDYNKILKTRIMPKLKRWVSKANGSIDGKQEVIKEEDSKDILTKDDYIKILNLLKTANFTDMLQVLEPKEAVIICLLLGYNDEKYYSTETVAEFLGIEVQEVRDVAKKILLLYQNKINDFIEKAVSYIAEDNKKLLK